MEKEPQEAVARPLSPQRATTDSLPSLPDVPRKAEATQGYKRDFRFWMVFMCITASQFITALELSAISTALPTIVEALHGEQFIWVGSGYMISTTAFVPLAGNCAQIFGRKSTMFVSILTFALGSALCGAAKSMNWLIAARVVQGVGSGGIQSMCQIIMSDLVPLKERGIFNGFLALAFIFANGTGPVIGGALAQTGQWRWLFYLNIPICGVVAVLVALFLKVRTPPGSLSEKIRKVDWIGNLLVISGTTSAMIGLTWGGIQYSWRSWHVLVPLILGLVGLAGFMVYETYIPKQPIVSYNLLSTRTSASGYLQDLLNFTVMAAVLYYLPVYFQACKDADPIASGVDIFGIAFTIAPGAVAAGLSITKTGRYRPQMWFAWALSVLSLGLLTTVNVDTPRGRVIGFEVLQGIGTGILGSCIIFPVLAPLPVELNAPALAVYMFFRNFACILGVVIGGTVLQNELKTQLPAEFVAQFPGSAAIAYSVIPLVPTLAEPLKGQVQAAFAGSVRVVWQVILGIAGLGFLSALLMRHIPLHVHVDERWGMEEKAGDPHELEGQRQPGETPAESGESAS